MHVCTLHACRTAGPVELAHERPGHPSPAFPSSPLHAPALTLFLLLRTAIQTLCLLISFVPWPILGQLGAAELMPHGIESPAAEAAIPDAQDQGSRWLLFQPLSLSMAWGVVVTTTQASHHISTTSALSPTPSRVLSSTVHGSAPA